MDGNRSVKMFNMKRGADAGKTQTKEWYTWDFIVHKTNKMA